MVDNFGIQTGTRHTEEAARLGAANTHRAGSDADGAHSLSDLRRLSPGWWTCAFHAPEHLPFRRENGQRHVRVKHAVRYFIDGSIAPGGNNEIATGLDFAARLKAGAAGRCGGDQMRRDTLTRQRGNGALEQMHVSRQASGNRVVDDGGARCAERFQDTL